jgi:hypothetical protein
MLIGIRRWDAFDNSVDVYTNMKYICDDMSSSKVTTSRHPIHPKEERAAGVHSSLPISPVSTAP